MNTSRIDLWTALLALLFSSAVLAGCDTERFNDPGCASDLECRGERICDANRCIHPDQLTPEADAGGDEDAEENGVRVQQLVGNWDMVANGTVRQAGETNDLDDDQTPVQIRQATQTDIEVILGDDEGGICGLGANLTADGFEFDPDGCETEVDGNQTISYENVDGTGTLDAGGTLQFDLRANALVQGPDMPTVTAEMDVVLEGTRIDEEPDF